MWLDYKGKRHFLPTEMPEEPFITIPFKSSEFCIWIDDADQYLRIFSAHST